MRISDWSSDVCSSDLGAGADEEQEAERRAGADHGQFNRARQSIGLDRRPIVSPHACWIAEAESGVGDAVEPRCGDAGAGTVEEGIDSSIEPAIDEPIFDLLNSRTEGMATEIVPASANEQPGRQKRDEPAIGIENTGEEERTVG